MAIGKCANLTPIFRKRIRAINHLSGENPPIGIILTTDKDAVMVEDAMHGISNKIFVSKYQLYMPDKKMLQKKVQEILDKE